MRRARYPPPWNSLVRDHSHSARAVSVLMVLVLAGHALAQLHAWWIVSQQKPVDVLLEQILSDGEIPFEDLEFVEESIGYYKF